MITERWSFELFFDRGGEGIGVGMSPRDLSNNHLAHPISPLDLPEIGILYLCYRVCNRDVRVSFDLES